MLKGGLKSIARRTACLSWRALEPLVAGRGTRAPVNFVVERSNWSIRWDGAYITEGVNRLRPGVAALTDRPERLAARRIVHFGSQYMWPLWGPHMSPTNRYLVTYFHGKPEDGPAAARNLEEVLRSLPRLDRVLTAATMTERRLLEWGVPREKLVRIPIGVDTALFTPAAPDERRELRARFGIPEDRVCIGSFQKDGVGWGGGMEPKLIKGPDVFLDVVHRLSREVPVFVLLSGPARGYVMRGLERMGIPYLHHFLEDYRQLADHYRALDLYLVTSREEGGPKAIMESMAAGVPIISTRVGMAPDLIVDGVNGWIADVDDVDALVEKALRTTLSPDLATSLKAQGRAGIGDYDWSVIATRHLDEVYAPLLDMMG